MLLSPCCFVSLFTLSDTRPSVRWSSNVCLTLFCKMFLFYRCHPTVGEWYTFSFDSSSILQRAVCFYLRYLILPGSSFHFLRSIPCPRNNSQFSLNFNRTVRHASISVSRVFYRVRVHKNLGSEREVDQCWLQFGWSCIRSFQVYFLNHHQQKEFYVCLVLNVRKAINIFVQFISK